MTFPARQYWLRNGERRSFALLQPASGGANPARRTNRFGMRSSRRHPVFGAQACQRLPRQHQAAGSRPAAWAAVVAHRTESIQPVMVGG